MHLQFVLIKLIFCVRSLGSRLIAEIGLYPNKYGKRFLNIKIITALTLNGGISVFFLKKKKNIHGMENSDRTVTKKKAACCQDEGY